MSAHSQDTAVSSQPLQQIPLTDQQPPGQSAATDTQDAETPVLLCTTDLFSNVPVDASTFDNIRSMAPVSNPGEGNSGMLSTSSASLSRHSSAGGNVDFNIGSTDNSVTASPMPYGGLGHEVTISTQCNSASSCPASCQNGPVQSNDENATVSRVTRQQCFDMQQGLVSKLSAPIDSDIVTPGSVSNASTSQHRGVGRPESTVSNTSFYGESENQRMDCDEHVVVGGIITQQVNTSEDALPTQTQEAGFSIDQQHVVDIYSSPIEPHCHSALYSPSEEVENPAGGTQQQSGYPHQAPTQNVAHTPATEQSGYPQVIQAATSLHVAPVQQQSAYPHLATSTQMIPSPRQSDHLQVTSSAQMASAPQQGFYVQITSSPKVAPPQSPHQVAAQGSHIRGRPL